MATIHKLQPKASFGRMECTACGVSIEAGCNCGVGYLPAGERAAKAVAANPEKSNRAISAATGIPEPTVRRARSRASNDAPAKRTGRDGKQYSSKRSGTITPETPQTDRAYEEIIKAKAEGRPIPPKKEFAKAIGISHMAVEKAWDRVHQEEEQAAAVTEAEDRALAKATFSEKAKLTIADAIRIHKARLDKQFEQRVNAEVRRRIDAADDAVRKQFKELHLKNLALERIIGQRGVFTRKEFHTLQQAFHTDRIERFKLDPDILEDFKTATRLLACRKEEAFGA